MDIDLDMMRIALSEAEAAASRGEVPIGAVLVDAQGAIMAQDGNRTIELRDPTAHAEILVIRKAAALLGNERLLDCSLYVTLEPCAMCAGAISFARVKRLVFGASDPKGGAVQHGAQFFNQTTCHHRPDCSDGLLKDEAADLLKSFFQARRNGQVEGRASSI